LVGWDDVYELFSNFGISILANECFQQGQLLSISWKVKQILDYQSIKFLHATISINTEHETELVLIQNDAIGALKGPRAR